MKFLEKKWRDMDPQERALLRAYGLMHELANYARLGNETAVAEAYEKSAELLAYGVDCDWEKLNNVMFKELV